MTSSLLIAGAGIDVRIEGHSLQVPAKDLHRWVSAAAESVTAYYGRFPVSRLLIQIIPFKGRGVSNGMAFGDRGVRITIRVGNETSLVGACL